MMNVTMIARTASIAKEYVNETRQGRNGQFQSKQIMFSMACDRKYRTTSIVNGQQTQDSPTDFWLVKFVGGAADAMQKYATGKKADGKLVSRYLYMEGTFETYKSNKPVKGVMKGVNLNGQLYDITGQLTPDGEGLTQTIFVVDYFKFLDSNPTLGDNGNGFTQNGPVQNIPMGGVMPIQQGFTAVPQSFTPVQQGYAPVQQTPVASVQAPVAPVQQGTSVQAPVNNIPAPMPTGAVPQTPAQPIAPIAPTGPVPQTSTAAPTQQNPFAGMMANVAQQMASQQAQAGAPAAPTIPANFQPTSGSAPF